MTNTERAARRSTRATSCSTAPRSTRRCRACSRRDAAAHAAVAGRARRELSGRPRAVRAAARLARRDRRDRVGARRVRRGGTLTDRRLHGNHQRRKVAGRIALVDRGACGFAIKVKNAQNAGAIGVVVANNVAGAPPGGMAGVDPTITIPSVLITQADANAIKAQLANSASVSGRSASTSASWQAPTRKTCRCCTPRTR